MQPNVFYPTGSGHQVAGYNGVNFASPMSESAFASWQGGDWEIIPDEEDFGVCLCNKSGLSTDYVTYTDGTTPYPVNAEAFGLPRPKKNPNL